MLRAESFQEIGEIIQRDAQTLIETWCRRAIEEQPHVARVHHAVLRDGLPKLLTAIGKFLAQSNAEEPSQHQFLAVEHGEHRWETGWSLPEVMHDYQILRLVVVDHLEHALVRPITSREVMAIGLALDEAISASVVMYIQFRDEAMHGQKLEEAEKLAEADRRKDEFLAMLAHELRNPLAPILNALEILRLPNVPPSVASESLAVADRQLRQLVRLVDDLLDVARISQGKLTLYKQRIDLAQCIGCAVESTRPLITGLQHQLQVEMPSEPLEVDADAARLEQVFTNLLNNAAKYTDRGGQIKLSASRDDRQALIRVRDNGMGIEPSLLSHIFELFVQSEDADDQARGGLGIGLALVQRLVQLHQGSVAVTSPGVGQGSEFTVRLPLAPSVAPNSGGAAAARPLPQARAKLLLVDDNKDVVNMLAMLLRRVGHEVLVAYDGDEALRLAVAEKPEVVLLDIGLPGRNGYEVASQMRELPELQGIHLVAMTGYGQDEDVRRAEQAGFDFHLLKPIRLESIQETLARCATRGKG